MVIALEVYISSTLPEPLYFAMVGRCTQMGHVVFIDSEEMMEIDGNVWAFYGFELDEFHRRKPHVTYEIELRCEQNNDEHKNTSRHLVELYCQVLIGKHRHHHQFDIYDMLMFDGRFHYSKTFLQGPHYLEETSEIDLESKHYWVSPRDVADAIYTCMTFPEGRGETVNICGRRGWTIRHTMEEFFMLQTRWKHGQSGLFNAGSLQSQSIPVSLEPFAGEVGHRPNLVPLHEMMLTQKEEGWRPYVPLRTMLMEVLSAIEK